MQDKAFLDSNILIYLHSEDDYNKRNIAQNILDGNGCITSLQAMNEISNVWFRKLMWSAEKIEDHLDNIEQVCDEVIAVSRATINNALSLKERYGFSYYDSLMLSSALESECNIIYSEDMSNGQIVEKTLKIINPFK
jgi:predicted nucleic acid-binding protein